MSETGNKEGLRRRMRESRDGLPAKRRKAWSKAIAERVLGLPEMKGDGVVFTYVSFRSEVETHGLIRTLLQRGVGVAAPQIIGAGVMVAQAIKSMDELAPGPYGILGPAQGTPIPNPPLAIGVTLVPGLAFSPRGDRLGYGTGHYDRWLTVHDGGLLVGLAFEAQVMEGVPTDEYDHPMHVVVTEKRVIRCAR